MKRKSSILIILILLSAAFSLGTTRAETYSNQYLSQWKDFSHTPEAKKLMAWLRIKAQIELKGRQYSQKLRINHPPFAGAIGLFITLTKNNRVRGCYGAFAHSSSHLNTILSDYLHGALRDDHRYKPLDISELDDTVIIITITSQPIQTCSIYSVDYSRYGIILDCNGVKRIFVPAELRCLSYIQQYIKRRNCQFSVFRAITIKG